MKTIRASLSMLRREPEQLETLGAATRYTLAMRTLLLAGLCAIGFGWAVGSTSLHLAMINTLNLPLVLLAPVLCSWPLGTLLGKMWDETFSASTLLLAQATALFGSALCLVAASPLVMLFYHSTNMYGQIIAMASAFGAACVGALLFFRKLRQHDQRKGLLLPAAIVLALYLLAALQMIGVCSPILPENTLFTQGIPGLF